MHNHLTMNNLTRFLDPLPQAVRKLLVINGETEDIYGYRVSPKGALTLLLLTTHIPIADLN